MGFDRLAPLVQHHIVNSLGWSALRPVQERAIGPILEGENVILLAGTAGGKTEAAFFPLLSLMVHEAPNGLSVLYLSPIRALLNNQVARLQQYFQWIGRQAEIWHGDTPESSRRKVRRVPPDCLLTTPESLEALLLSTRLDPTAFFAELRMVVIDEIHAFAGDDRGWHLLAVLERLAALTGRDLQRVGLSATVGNRQELVSWMSGSSCRPRRTVESDPPSVPPQVTLDYVGSLENAARVVSRLHRGEKRLVFCDSRLRAELLAAALRQHEIATFITHSSLSMDGRLQAERAFRENRDCVIVATSALELGIDVGDLDRVIQLDAPNTVASFLQRMGRTGRRAATTPNCLFLATSDAALLRATAIIHLWRTGFVEAAEAPPVPLHVLAQQCLAIVLQHRTLGRGELEALLHRLGERLHVSQDTVSELLVHLSADGWLSQDGGQIWIGPRSEGELGRRNYLELLSVFTSPPLFRVLHGRKEIGQVHAFSFLPGADEDIVLVLAGRFWTVTHVDWRAKLAHVKPAATRGRSRWLGIGAGLSLELCEAVRAVLTGKVSVDEHLSMRGRSRLEELLEEFSWLKAEVNHVLARSDGSLEIWTFGGTRGNRLLAAALGSRIQAKVRFDELSLRLKPSSEQRQESVLEALHSLSNDPPGVTDDDLRGLAAAKFSSCLPPALERTMATSRFGDERAYRRMVSRGWNVTVE